MTPAWLGLGGNIGDVRAALATALRALNDDEYTAVTAVSSLYRTPPWGKEDQPWFVNCCAEVTTSLSPEHLLELCQAVERAGKRERLERWGPRTIDVDIIAVAGTEQTEQRLTLPHPHAHERAFVLTPLAEIAQGLVLNGSTVADLAMATSDPRLERIDAPVDWWRD